MTCFLGAFLLAGTSVLAGARVDLNADRIDDAPANKVPVLIDFSSDKSGAQPDAFASLGGTWRVGAEGRNKFLVAVAAKPLVDFPLAVYKRLCCFRGGELRLRFKPMSGRIDQAAGIIFDLKPNGDYLVLRANSLEDNLILFKFVAGIRFPVKEVDRVPTAGKTWHELKVVVRGAHIEGFLDGKLTLEYDWTAPIDGQVGLWSKADSVVYFDDFAVEPARAP